MALAVPAPAPSEDLLVRLGLLLERELDAAERSRAELLLEDALGLIRGFCGALPEPLPDEVGKVAVGMVHRVMSAADVRPGVESNAQTAGPFGQTVRYTEGASSGGVWLSAADKLRLRPYRLQVTSVGVVSERTL